ncbi:MAG: SIS domain-containing protein [Chloroflexi bacterium]|nr:SIS domain-containing protein [Chloroflexota bacterium]
MKIEAGRPIRGGTHTAQRFTQRYVAELKGCLDSLPTEEVAQVIDVIYEAYTKGKQVFIMGNGGSAATASHFACDLGKGTVIAGKPRFRVLSLNDNMALVTALSNDMGYDCVFREQLVNLVSEGDVVIAISASGNSENIVQAIEYANSRGAITVGLLGFGGGRLKEMVTYGVVLPSRSYGLAESVHQFLEHLITEYFRLRIARPG